jgi:hypothetical protein
MNRHGRIVAEVVTMIEEGYGKAAQVKGLGERGVRATRLLRWGAATEASDGFCRVPARARLHRLQKTPDHVVLTSPETVTFGGRNGSNGIVAYNRWEL